MKKVEEQQKSTDTALGSIVLLSRHVGWAAALIILLNASSFLVGYFWGKRVSAEKACCAINRESFADQIYSAVCLRQGIMPEDEQDADESEKFDEEDELLVDGSENQANDPVTIDTNASSVEEAPAQYYAQLISFHTRKAGDQFVEKLRKKAIPVILKERVSKTARGRRVAWYQVVAGPYESREVMTTVVAQLKKEEKIKDVRIVQG